MVDAVVRFSTRSLNLDVAVEVRFAIMSGGGVFWASKLRRATGKKRGKSQTGPDPRRQSRSWHMMRALRERRRGRAGDAIRRRPGADA
jgi:hypothetical protein